MFALPRWKRPRGAGTNAANRKNYRALRKLDDRTLKDIGLFRSDVESFHCGCDPRRGPDPF